MNRVVTTAVTYTSFIVEQDASFKKGVNKCFILCCNLIYLSHKITIIKTIFTKRDTQINKMLILAMGLRCANHAISCRSETLMWLNFNEQLCGTLFPSVNLLVLINDHGVTYCDYTAVHWPQWLPFVVRTLHYNSHKNYGVVRLFPLTLNIFNLHLLQTIQFTELRCTAI